MRRPARHPQQGAALLLAMVIVTLVATLAAGMVWQQWRSIEVESAERARVQSSWLLDGALDWARLILREDAREGGSDALTEPWATGLAEIRLSTFLSTDKDNTDTDIDAFLSGDIADAQARYNLQNLATDDTKIYQAELVIFSRLCDLLGLPDWVFPLAGLCVGYPENNGVITPRLPLEVTVHTDRFSENDIAAKIDAYDRRRAALQPYKKQRGVKRFGEAPFYGWSEDKARHYSVPERSDFGAYIRDQKFSLK